MNKLNFRKRCNQFNFKFKDMTWEKPYYPVIKIGGLVTLICFLPLIFIVSYFEESELMEKNEKNKEKK